MDALELKLSLIEQLKTIDDVKLLTQIKNLISIATEKTVRTGIVHQGNPFCPLQQTIEIVCIYGNQIGRASCRERV